MTTKEKKPKKAPAPVVEPQAVVDPHALTPDEQARMDRPIQIALLNAFWPERYGPTG